ncbi:hypothetical protein [Pontibacter ummariensis]|nr:hypothetical protein [Pontibacter ummariensis]
MEWYEWFIQNKNSAAFLLSAAVTLTVVCVRFLYVNLYLNLYLKLKAEKERLEVRLDEAALAPLLDINPAFYRQAKHWFREDLLLLQKDLTKLVRPLHNRQMNRKLQKLIRDLEEISTICGHRDIEPRMNKWTKRFYALQQEIVICLVDLRVLQAQ